VLYRSRVGDQGVMLECDPKLHGAAEVLFDYLKTLSAKGVSPYAGIKISYGWSILTLQAEEGLLRVCEPAFDRNPFEETNPTMDNTFRVVEQQTLVLRRSGLSGLSVLFSDNLFVRNMALEAPNQFLKRQVPAGNQDSGWYIGNLDRIEADETDDEFEILRVFELLRRRPAVLQVLMLPPDYVVVLRDDEVSEILDKHGTNHWR
jgi:hypothetical protein